MKKLYFLLIVILLLMQVSVKADEKCSKGEIERLKYLADKVDFTYDYEWRYVKTDKVNGVDTKYYRAYFTIYAHNLNDELKVLVENDYLSEDYREFKDNGKGEGSLSDFRENDNVVITIRAYADNECLGRKIAVKRVPLPHLNVLAYTPVCQKNPEFKHCREWVENGNIISSERFYEEYEDYVKNLEESKKTEEINVPKKDTSKTYEIWFVFGAIILISLIATIITRIIITKRKESI